MWSDSVINKTPYFLTSMHLTNDEMKMSNIVKLRVRVRVKVKVKVKVKSPKSKLDPELGSVMG